MLFSAVCTNLLSYFIQRPGAYGRVYRRRKADNACCPYRIEPVGAPVLTFAGAYTITDTPKHIDPARQRRTVKE